MAKKTISGLSPFLLLGHVVNDMSSNALSGLLPVLAAFFSLSYLLTSVVAMVFNVTSSIIQPLLGRWFDRTQASWLLEIGVALNCIGMGLVGLASNYSLLLILVGIAGLGSAAFHPPAFSAVVKSSSSSRGKAMGIFLSGGNTGFFMGPILAGVLATSFGLRGMILILPLGVVTAGLLFRMRGELKPRLPYGSAGSQPANKRLLSLLIGITALRSVAIQGAVTFLPLYFVARGDSLLLATLVASFWLAVGVFGQMGGGFLSDRIGRRPVIVGSLLLGAAAFYGFLSTANVVSLVLLGISGVTLYASWSVMVAMSSEAAPANVGAVSGLMLGLSVGIGGLGVLGFGAAADLVGLTSAFNLVIVFALAAGIMGIFLPRWAGVAGYPTTKNR